MSKVREVSRKCPIEFDKFITKRNSVQLMIYEDNNGVISLKNKVRLRHKKIKSCPHCGGMAEVHHVKAYGVLHGFTIKCKKCYCSSGVQYEGNTISFGDKPTQYWSFSDALTYVVDNWNKRY